MVNKRSAKSTKRGGTAEEKEFDQEIIDIARVTRVMAGGKRMRFRACVAVGDRKGKVGTAVAKGADVTMAVNKAVALAKKHLLRVKTVNETIPCAIKIKFKAARILLKPAPKGTGVKAGGSVRQILELAGVANATAKILGSNNKISNAYATMEALRELNEFEGTTEKDYKLT